MPSHYNTCRPAVFAQTLPGLLAALALLGATWAMAEDDAPYSPYAGRDFPENLYWGDTHLHTALSFDANFSGTYKVGLEEAYRVARGETITGNKGEPVRLDRPLDFLVVSDHAHALGVIDAIWKEDPRLMSQADGARWLDILKQARGDSESTTHLVATASRTPEGVTPLDTAAVQADTWQETLAAAERYNEPGRFTAFIGYEWTAMIQGNNLHRVVIFRDGADRVATIRPFSMGDSQNPEDLWAFMEAYENDTDGRVLAIPHNGNVSNGMMFSGTDVAGQPITREYAATRAKWEPLYEITQIKGDAETHPALSPEDRFADYETWDGGNVAGTARKEPWMLEYEYGRSALRLGLQHEENLGINPFKLGFIGSTDSHTGMPAVGEDNMMGKFGVDEPSAERAFGHLRLQTFDMPTAKYAASGYAAVWARENTREAIFDAMQRRETYATTGPRMVVRFFGGWDFDDHDHLHPDHAAIGYRKGVPMGGDLTKAPGKGAPTFLIVASKDPLGANLERVQVVKGWLDASGATGERVYDVALSNRREPVANITAPPIRSTVDVASATYTNSVGDVQLSTVWRDPDFDPRQRAFYYLRVLEIPTPRWTTRDAAFYGTGLADGVPTEHQERAYTSPIWYTPSP